MEILSWIACAILALIYGLIRDHKLRAEIIEAIFTVIALCVAVLVWPALLYSVSKDLEKDRLRRMAP